MKDDTLIDNLIKETQLQFSRHFDDVSQSRGFSHFTFFLSVYETSAQALKKLFFHLFFIYSHFVFCPLLYTQKK